MSWLMILSWLVTVLAAGALACIALAYAATWTAYLLQARDDVARRRARAKHRLESTLRH